MLKKRLIAVLVVRDGQVVQSERFRHPHVIHRDPVMAVECFNKWAVDEIVVLNVSRDSSGRDHFLSVVDSLSTACFVPLAAGGWVDGVDYARSLLKVGADKVVVNTEAFKRPSLIQELANQFGRQCVVVSLDVKRDEQGVERVCVDRGRELTEADPVWWAKRAAELGAGELFVNSIEHDGKRQGYNLPLMSAISGEVNLPVIAFGGVFRWQDLVDGVEVGGVDAVAAANIFHYTEHSCRKAKRYLIESGLQVREG